MISELLDLLGPLAAPEPGVLPGLEALLLGDPRLAVVAGTGTAAMGAARSPGSGSPVRVLVGSPGKLSTAGGGKGPPLDSM